MMRSLLLTLALVLGQTGAVAHAVQHDSTVPTHECALCVHASPLDSAAPPSAPTLIPPTVTTRLRAVAVAEVVARPFHDYRSRGPPESSLI